MDNLSDILAAIERKGHYWIEDTNMFLKLNFMGSPNKGKAFHAWLAEHDLKSTEEWAGKVQQVRIYRPSNSPRRQ